MAIVVGSVCLLGSVSLYVVGPEPEKELIQPVASVNQADHADGADHDAGAPTESSALIKRSTAVTQIEVNFTTRRLVKVRIL